MRNRKQARSKMTLRDLIGSGVLGLRTRTGRTILTAAGIAIGIASMVAVLGISSSSRADVLAEIDRLGTNLLAVQPGNSIYVGEQPKLPDNASDRIRRIPATEEAASLAMLDVDIVRSDVMPNGRSGGVTVAAVDPELLTTLKGTVAEGRFLGSDDTALPVIVLGSEAADRMGISSTDYRATVSLDGNQFLVVGVLDPLSLYPDIDRMALIGFDVAEHLFDAERAPTTVYLRADPDWVEPVREILARSVDPESPEEINVSRPSETLEARAKIDQNLTNLLLGLGAVALLVGAVGIANIMVISVLERRAEIGVRRALGATRRHIAGQFVVESAALASIGGTIGIALGAAVTFGYARRQSWTVDIPIEGLAGGILGALVIGILAGLYPAIKAARLDPAEAVRPS